MDSPKFQVQDRVRIHNPHSTLDGQDAVILWVDQYGLGIDETNEYMHEYTVQLVEGNEFPAGPSRYILERDLEKIGTFDLSGYVGWQNEAQP